FGRFADERGAIAEGCEVLRTIREEGTAGFHHLDTDAHGYRAEHGAAPELNRLIREPNAALDHVREVQDVCLTVIDADVDDLGVEYYRKRVAQREILDLHV